MAGVIKNVKMTEPYKLENKKPSSRATNGKLNNLSEWNPKDITSSIASEIADWDAKISRDIAEQKQHYDNKIKQAHKEGYEKGLAEGIEREKLDHIDSIEKLLREAKRKNRDALRYLEAKIIHLAALMAQKLTRKSIEDHSEIAVEIVREVMTTIVGNEKVILKVSPEDFKTINAKYNEWMSMAGNYREFKIEINKMLRSGDFLVETEGGIIDATISDRIDVLVNELLKVST